MIQNPDPTLTHTEMAGRIAQACDGDRAKRARIKLPLFEECRRIFYTPAGNLKKGFSRDGVAFVMNAARHHDTLPAESL